MFVVSVTNSGSVLHQQRRPHLPADGVGGCFAPTELSSTAFSATFCPGIAFVATVGEHDNKRTREVCAGPTFQKTSHLFFEPGSAFAGAGDGGKGVLEHH